jgi:hypothetical protein
LREVDAGRRKSGRKRRNSCLLVKTASALEGKKNEGERVKGKLKIKIRL